MLSKGSLVDQLNWESFSQLGPLRHSWCLRKATGKDPYRHIQEGYECRLCAAIGPKEWNSQFRYMILYKSFEPFGVAFKPAQNDSAIGPSKYRNDI